MKKHIFLLSLFTFSLLLTFTACKKDSSSDDNNTTEISTHSDDQSQFASEVDAVANDADIALESSTSFSGRYQGVRDNIICDANIALNTVTNPRTITITYDGTNCFGNRTRTGVVTLSMAQGVQWKNAGAVVTVTFQNLKITRTIDNKSITINGTQTYTNVSGGLLINLGTPGTTTITHAIASSGLSVTFDNGSQRSWQVAKQRVFSGNITGDGVITTTGTHTEGSNTGIAEWGTNRFGVAFTTSIVEPLVVRQNCSFRLTSGQVKYITAGFTATATFGLNVNGNLTSCPGIGHYYYKLVWNGANGGSLSLILAY